MSFPPTRSVSSGSDLPQTVDGPRVRRPRCRAEVPELRLQQCTAGIIEAAGGVLGRTLATESAATRARLEIGRDSGHHGRQGQHARERHLDNENKNQRECSQEA